MWGGIIKSFIVSLISNLFPLTLLLVCGIYLSLKGGFFQLTRFPDSSRLMLKAFKSKQKSDFTSFKAACTSLSAAVGTGNIAGVAGALSIGGAGAIFWMWISALCGMCIKAAEITVGVVYRENHTGGPMYYIKNGLPQKFKPLGIAFSLAGIPAVFCSGNITQANAAVTAISGNFYVRLTFGIIFALLTLAVITGGIKRIGTMTEKIVPIMSALYIILCVTVIILNIDFLPSAFKMIIEGAFNPKAVTGGAVGSVLSSAMIGAERGVFSNEAGLGTAAMAHSAAVDADPRHQGLFGIFEVFVDTILLCTLTALTVLCSEVSVNYGQAASSELVISALEGAFSSAAAPMIAVMLCLFAFSSIIGWAVYGSICTEFLFGGKGVKIFLILYPLGSVFGAISETELAWQISAFFNGIMLIINLTAIILLSDTAIKYLKRGNNDV